MSDPLFDSGNRNASRESAEIARQDATERMGAGFVVGHEKPKRDLTLLNGKPVALPWSTGKPLGTQAKAFGGLARIIGEDGQISGTRLTFNLNAREQSHLAQGARESETQEMVNLGLGIPTTKLYDEGDHLAMNDGLPRCDKRNESGLRCIWLSGHYGECQFDPSWDKEHLR